MFNNGFIYFTDLSSHQTGANSIRDEIRLNPLGLFELTQILGREQSHHPFLIIQTVSAPAQDSSMWIELYF